jgi:hypothetical protein
MLRQLRTYNQNVVNEQIAHRLITTELQRLRASSYFEPVQRIGKPETFQITGEDGSSYQLEAQAFWDGSKGGDVRVMVAADDGGWRAFKPLTDDFIMRPDGSFVDE